MKWFDKFRRSSPALLFASTALCVSLVHPPDDLRDPATGTESAKRHQSLISANVEEQGKQAVRIPRELHEADSLLMQHLTAKIIRRDWEEFLWDHQGEVRVSPFDPLFREHAREIGWDWRLLASLAFHESTFNPKAVSQEGAMGLMQVLPRTSRAFGEYNLTDPEENLMVSILFLKSLWDGFPEIADSGERMKFTLAAYNAGKGHVEDARRLAIKYGKDPDTWFSHTEVFMFMKSKEAYYQDEVVRYGYCRGHESVLYVRKVFQVYSAYKSVT